MRIHRSQRAFYRLDRPTEFKYRILKKEGDQIIEAYFEDRVISNDGMYQPIKVNGTIAGVLENGHFIPIPADFRGSVLEDLLGTLNIATPYGERSEDRYKYSNLIDYVSLGHDPDLKAYRMSQRDYDPVVKRYLTPDPLFLEHPEHCVESSHECNLYSYARGNPVSFVDPSGKASLGVLLTAGGGAGIGGYGSLGFVISYSQEHGLMAAWRGNAGHTTNAGEPGGTVGISITLSPSEHKLENGISDSMMHGFEFEKPLGGGVDHNYSLDGSGEHSVTINIGYGYKGEYHTGVEREATWGATTLIPGSATTPSSNYRDGGSSSLNIDFNKNSTPKGDVF